tara:strand:- start:150 stop:422 length:273 start_codon:yes stop_codon:yes gene_type:complete
MKKIEVFLIQGTPLWFFLPYSFQMELKLFTNLNSGVVYKSTDLILSDKELIEKKIIDQFKVINKEIILEKSYTDFYEVNHFNLMKIETEE